MSWQQAGGAYISTNPNVSSPTTAQLVLDTALDGHTVISSGKVVVKGSGPIFITGQIVFSSASTAILRMNGNATNLASGSSATTSSFTYSYPGARDGDLLELWYTTASFGETITGGSGNSFLKYIPQPPCVMPDPNASMIRAAFF